MALATPGPNHPIRKIDFGVLTDTFNTAVKHWQVFLTAGVVMIGVALPVAIADFIPSAFDLGQTGFEYDWAAMLTLEILLFIPSLIVSPLICIGVTKFTLNVSRGNPPNQADLWEGFRKPISYLSTAFIAGLITTLGLILFCFGVYVTGGLMMFAFPLKVDTGASSLNVTNESWNMLKGDWVMAAIFYLVIGMIAGIGASVIPIAAMLTLPLMYIAQVHLYNRYTGYYSLLQPQTPAASPYPRQSQSAQQGTGQDPLKPNNP